MSVAAAATATAGAADAAAAAVETDTATGGGALAPKRKRQKRPPHTASAGSAKTARVAQPAPAAVPRTWPEIVADPRSEPNARKRAENAVADRMAYFAKIHSLLSLYMRHRGVWMRAQRQQTWKHHADTLYTGMLRRQRALANGE